MPSRGPRSGGAKWTRVVGPKRRRGSPAVEAVVDGTAQAKPNPFEDARPPTPDTQMVNTWAASGDLGYLAGGSGEGKREEVKKGMRTALQQRACGMNRHQTEEIKAYLF